MAAAQAEAVAAVVAAAAASAPAPAPAVISAPKIIKTTTKQMVVQNAEGVRHKKEEKVEDLTPGGTGAVTVVSSTNKV